MDKKTLIIAAFLGSFACMLIGGISVWLIKTDTSNKANQKIETSTLPVSSSTLTTKLNSDDAIAKIKQIEPTLNIDTKAPELLRFDGQLAYEIMTSKGAFYVDANTGILLSQPTIANQNMLAYNQAKQYEDDDDDDEHHKKTKRKHREHDDD